MSTSVHGGEPRTAQPEGAASQQVEPAAPVQVSIARSSVSALGEE